MDEVKFQVDMRSQALKAQMDFLRAQQELYATHPEVITTTKNKSHKRLISLIQTLVGATLILAGLYMIIFASNWIFGTGLIMVGILLTLVGTVPFIDATDADKFEKMSKVFNLVFDKIKLPERKELPDNDNKDT